MKCKRTKKTFLIVFLLLSLFLSLFAFLTFLIPKVRATEPTGRINGLTVVLDSISSSVSYTTIVNFMQTWHYNGLKLYVGWCNNYWGTAWTGNVNDPIPATAKTKISNLISACAANNWYVSCTVSDQVSPAKTNDTWHDQEVQVGWAGPNSDLNSQDNWLDVKGPRFNTFESSLIKSLVDLMDNYVRPRIGVEEIQYVTGGGHPTFYAQCMKDAYFDDTGLAIPYFASASAKESTWTSEQWDFINYVNASTKEFYQDMRSAALAQNSTTVFNIMMDDIWYYESALPFIYYTQPTDYFGSAEVEMLCTESFGSLSSNNWARLLTALNGLKAFQPSAKHFMTYGFASVTQMRTGIQYAMDAGYDGVWLYSYSLWKDSPFDVSDIVFEEDTEPPTYSNLGTNTTIAGQPCKFYVKWTDDVGLSKYRFGTNNTGSWVNDTWTSLSGNPAWSNVTKTLNSTVGVKIAYRFWCNDTSNNWADTELTFLTTSAGSVTIEVYDLWISDSRLDYGSQVTIKFRHRYSNNQTACETGTSYVNGTSCAINSTGWITYTKTYSAVVKYTFTVTQVNVKGYTTFQMATSDAEVVWDRLTVTFSTSKSNPALTETVIVSWTITRQFDSSTVTSFTIDISRNGTLWKDDLTSSSTTDVSSETIARIYTLYPSTVTDNTYGITVAQANNVTITWAGTPPDNPPTYGSHSVSTTMAGANAIFECEWADDNLLYYGILSHNSSGTWVNRTALSMFAPYFIFTDSFTLPLEGVVIAYRFYANDTLNQWNSTAVLQFVVSTFYVHTSSAPSGAIAYGTGFNLYFQTNGKLAFQHLNIPWMTSGATITLTTTSGTLNGTSGTLVMYSTSGTLTFTSQHTASIMLSSTNSDLTTFHINGVIQNSASIFSGQAYTIQWNFAPVIPLLPSVGSTFYFRSDPKTTNNVTAYYLHTTESSSSITLQDSSSSSLTAYYAFTVQLLHSWG